MQREKSYHAMFSEAMGDDQKLGPVYPAAQQHGRKGSDPSTKFRGAVHAIRATLPSTQVQHSQQGAVLGRKKINDARSRRNTLAPGKTAADMGAASKRRRSTIHPEMILQAQDKGLKLSYEDEEFIDEVDRLKQLEVIKSMPVPLKVKRKLRNKLMERMPDISKDSCDMCAYKCRVSSYRCRLKSSICWREFRSDTTLWSGAFKTIEGHFGAGVLTYFKFLKWLFQLNILIFLAVTLFVVLPQATLNTHDYSAGVTGTENYTDAVYVAINCTSQYEVNVSSDGLRQMLDFLQGTGWMEKTSMFYGYYSDREMEAFGNWTYNMPLAYIVICAFYYLISLVLMVHHTAKGFRERLFANEDALKQYCNKAFACWDYAMDNAKNCMLRQKSIFRELTGSLEEERNAARRQERTGNEKCKLFGIRALINAVVVCLLVGSGYLIYFVTVKMTELQEGDDFQTYSYPVQFLIGFTTSLTITILNALVPIIFKRVVRFEDYTPAFEINLTLCRTVFLRLASVGVLIFTMYSEITCKPQDMCGVGEAPTCTPVQCWETYVGQELYKLVIMDFLVVFCVTFFVEFPRKLIVSKCDCKLSKIIGLQQFDITKNVLDLVYSQVLLWLGTFFSPLIPVVCVLKLFFVFYIKELTLLVNYAPSPTNYRASDSQSFFLIVLICAYTVCVVPILFIIFRMTPSRSCGPFRIYDNMYAILPITVNAWPQWIQNITEWVFSAMILIPLFIILCLVIYYLDKVWKAYRAMTKTLKEQLHMEGRDKQFLLARIQELSGGNGNAGGSTRKKALPPPSIHEDVEAPRLQKRASKGAIDTRAVANMNSPPNVPE